MLAAEEQERATRRAAALLTRKKKHGRKAGASKRQRTDVSPVTTTSVFHELTRARDAVLKAKLRYVHLRLFMLTLHCTVCCSRLFARCAVHRLYLASVSKEQSDTAVVDLLTQSALQEEYTITEIVSHAAFVGTVTLCRLCWCDELSVWLL